MLYLERKEYEKVISLSRDTLQIDPVNLKAYVALSEALSFLDKLKEAAAELQKVLELVHQQEWIKHEDLNILHQQLGIIYVMQGQKELALTHFQKALEALPDDEWTRQLQESYEILDIMGLTLKETRQERRGRLLGLTQQRTNAREQGYENVIEKVVAGYTIEDIAKMDVTGALSELKVIKGMLKFWPPEFFIEFAHVHTQSEVEALQGRIEEIFKT